MSSFFLFFFLSVFLFFLYFFFVFKSLFPLLSLCLWSVYFLNIFSTSASFNHFLYSVVFLSPSFYSDLPLLFVLYLIVHSFCLYLSVETNLSLCFIPYCPFFFTPSFCPDRPIPVLSLIVFFVFIFLSRPASPDYFFSHFFSFSFFIFIFKFTPSSHPLFRFSLSFPPDFFLSRLISSFIPLLVLFYCFLSISHNIVFFNLLASSFLSLLFSSHS